MPTLNELFPIASLYKVVTVDVPYIIQSIWEDFYFYSRSLKSLINQVNASITLFNVDPCLIRASSAWLFSINISEPGKSRKVSRDFRSTGALVSLLLQVYLISKRNRLVALLDSFPNSLLVLSLFLAPFANFSITYSSCVT